jgi:hypothetical protein
MEQKGDRFLSCFSWHTDKWLWLYDPETLNTRKCPSRHYDTGDIFNLNFDVANVILFYHLRAPDRVPLVICNFHRIVICKHIVLIFSLYVKAMFHYLSYVKSCMQIKKCDQQSRSPRTFWRALLLYSGTFYSVYVQYSCILNYIDISIESNDHYAIKQDISTIFMSGFDTL